MIGKKKTGHANLLTLTERKTRMGFIAKVDKKISMQVNSVIFKLVKKYNLKIKTITSDNGFEFDNIGLLAKWLDIKVYKADLYASFQRGSNEHFNGLIRRRYKKGFDFNQLTQEDIDDLMDKINNMPRKILNWQSAAEVFWPLNNQ
ncbi:IS30 family transposase [Mycoplasmopsis pulmonis]|uniref:IS30 family transposase n=1 Tax=Mycoplasmopsis pulmonis TaxID=2107 RepID=UPI0006827945|nr:IS30 family transposase [Mycoplasmopsis pulmonis]